MPRRSSYLCSIDSQYAGENTLRPPSVIDEVKSEKGSKSGSIVSIVISETFKDDVLQPLFLYTSLLGLNEGYSPKWQPVQRVYNYFVIVVLWLSSFRRIYQIGVREPGATPLSWHGFMFDPTIVLTCCNAFFVLSGALSVMVLQMMRGMKDDFRKSFEAAMSKYREERDDKKAKRNNIILVVSSLVFTLLSSVATLLYRFKALNLPWIPPLIADHWYFLPFEFYVVFVTESAISVLTIFFAQTCGILRISIQNLLKMMNPPHDEEEDGCPLPEESLRRIREVQVQHQEILNAKTMLEENFSFVLFFSYGFAIPAICFLGYLILKNINGNWALHLSLGMWMVTTLAALLTLSIPAFMVHEEGDKLLSASFKMYHEALCEERDLLVVSQMTLLVFQIHSAKLTLSASNYFSMNRKILLSLFSAIFTYFLILVQFGEISTEQQEAAAEEARNITLI